MSRSDSITPPYSGARVLHRDVRMLIAVRVVAVSALLIAALLIQFTSDVVLPIDYIYATSGIAFALTIGYVIFARFFESRELNIAIQTGGDLVLETLLVYFTGGIDSPFSFLYLISIITASMLLYRRGGLLTASAAAILYGVLVDLLYYGILPLPAQSLFTPGPWTATRLYLNMATNFAGFYATALLTSYISEQLRLTFRELDVNRESLAALQALNQNVVQSISSGLITLTPDGIVSFVNPAGREILALAGTRLVGRHISASGMFSAEEWEEIRKRSEADEIFRAELTLRREGEPRMLGYTITPLETIDGRTYGLTIIFQDLTELKKLEAQLRLKDRMAAVGELSAGIAHEIRNPLSAIAGSAQVLKSSSSLTTQEQRLISIIVKESERLDKSISDFLRFVKPHEKQLQEFDIAASLGETLDLLGNSPELTPDHRIVREIDPPSCTVVGDPDQIRQVFWNVARNAIQAMPGAGTLRVKTAVGEGQYRITFVDSGRGISHEEQRTMFQPFRTNFPSGSGLGMAISYRIVQEHGGKIDVDSKKGVGTKITLSLPLSGVPSSGSPLRRGRGLAV
jgi:two-component system, NtrC family, sensor histidine kinase PilS